LIERGKISEPINGKTIVGSVMPTQIIVYKFPVFYNSLIIQILQNILDVYKRPYDPARPVVGMDEIPKQFSILEIIPLTDISEQTIFTIERRRYVSIYLTICYDYVLTLLRFLEKFKWRLIDNIIRNYDFN